MSAKTTVARLWKWILTPIGVAVAVAMGWGVYQDSLARVSVPVVETPPPPFPVRVTRVQRQTLEDRAELVGGLEADAQVQVRARVSGYLTNLPHDVGEFIDIGTVLVELDDSQYQQGVNRALAALKVTQAQLRAQESKAAVAQTRLDRARDLRARGVGTAEDLETAESEFQVAQAELELEQARVDLVESELRQAELQQQESRIRSPVRGYVAQRWLEVGDLANSTDTILTIVQMDKVRTIVHVVERDYPRVLPGQDATIDVDAYPGRQFPGKVIRKAPALDPQTRTAAVQIEFPNPEHLLKPGMHARVAIVFERYENAPALPIAALIEHERQPAVYAVAGEPPQAILRLVRTGVVDHGYVQILQGLEPGEAIVTQGNRLVTNGQTVQPIEIPIPTLARSDSGPNASEKESPVSTQGASEAGGGDVGG